MNYYNENDPKAAAWLRELIAAKMIPAGFIDTRPIQEVKPNDLTEYDQCHFFAGIGGWPYALDLAQWDSAHPVWTGSCPCQPFSVAGKGAGEADPRHLWPAFRALIAERRPPVVFGEQVASKAGRGWLARVRADLEALGYAVGAADLCAAGAGTPHIRQRLYWVAHSNSRRFCEGNGKQSQSPERQSRHGKFKQRSQIGGMADSQGELWNRSANSSSQTRRSFAEIGGTVRRLGDADSAGREQGRPAAQTDGHGSAPQSNGGACGVGHAQSQYERGQRQPRESGRREVEAGGSSAGGGPCGVEYTDHSGRQQQCRPVAVPEKLPSAELRGNPWHSFDILHCTDGKARRIEPGSFPLAHGVPGRVGLLRGYGNAIVPEIAAEFVRAFLET